jgi:pimeloyl-ACP methyl ester carboxylesterase
VSPELEANRVIDRSEELAHLRAALAVAGLTVPNLVVPTSHHAVLGGIRLHYLDWGLDGAYPIMFMHGGSLTARTWDLVCLSLRDEYHCIAADLRGHGDSEWPPDGDYSFNAGEHDILNLADSLGLGKFVLVGMSQGGLYSTQFAGDHSDRLAGLVLVDIGPELDLDGAKRIVSFTQTDIEMDSVEDFVFRSLKFNPRRDPALLRRSLLHNLRRLPSGKWTWKWDRRRLDDIDFEEMSKQHASLWNQVAKIGCPTLIVRGAQSDVFTVENAKRLANALAYGRWVEVPNSGHTIQGDNPAGLLEVLKPFLAEVATAR